MCVCVYCNKSWKSKRNWKNLWACQDMKQGYLLALVYYRTCFMFWTVNLFKFFFGVLEIIPLSLFFFNSFIVFGCKWLKTTNCKLTSNVRRVFSYTLQVFVGGKHVRGYMHVFSRRMSSFGRVWCLEAIMSFHSSCMLRWYHTFIHCWPWQIIILLF